MKNFGIFLATDDNFLAQFLNQENLGFIILSLIIFILLLGDQIISIVEKTWTIILY